MKTPTPFFAAIDSTDPIFGAVYGVGETEFAARVDAAQTPAQRASFRVVSCTPAAAAYVRDNGGAPTDTLTVTARGVCLRQEED